jgi:glycosyltransferase involved in cell wall biosynthesis
MNHAQRQRPASADDRSIGMVLSEAGTDPGTSPAAVADMGPVRLRILRINPYLPPLPGGMEKHVLRLSEEQRRSGCEVAILFSAGSASGPDDMRVLAQVPLRQARPQSLAAIVFHAAAAIRLLRGNPGFDVVHIHGDWSAFLFGPLLARLCGATVLVGSIHGRTRSDRWAGIYRWALRGYDIVYCTGAADADWLRRAGVACARWQTSGVDDAFVGDALPTATTCDVVCVAHCFPCKNLGLVLDIALAMPQSSFELIGDGPDRAGLERRCQDEGIANVRFSGTLTADGVRSRLGGARVCLSTSFAEGTPTAVLEAMACGLPVVSSRSNDYSGLIVDGRNGYLVDGFSAPDYVAPLRRLLDDEPGRRLVAVRNVQVGRTKVWWRVASTITQWMREVVMEKRRHRGERHRAGT